MQTHQLWDQMSNGGSARPESRLPTLQDSLASCATHDESQRNVREMDRSNFLWPVLPAHRRLRVLKLFGDSSGSRVSTLLPSRSRTEENGKRIRGKRMIHVRRSTSTRSGKIDSRIA
jgi:hypothetical protein